MGMEQEHIELCAWNARREFAHSECRQLNILSAGNYSVLITLIQELERHCDELVVSVGC